ncbi:MAG: glycosyltransferase [Candidatus Krumholzibacteriia bacterium]
MRITLFGPAPPFRGGIVTYLGMLARVLEQRGHEVGWVSFRKQYPGLIFPGSEQTGETAPWLVRPSEPTFVPWEPWSWWRTAGAIARQRPDAVIFKYWIPFFAPGYHGTLRRLRALRRRGGPGPAVAGTSVAPVAATPRIIAILDNVIPHEKSYPFGARFTRAALRQADGFLAQSEQVRRDLAAVVPGIAPGRVITSPHPVYDFTPPDQPRPTRAEARAAVGIPTEQRLVLFFGFIKPYKGVAHLIDAAPRLRERFGPEGIRVLIAGDVYGDARRYTESVARSGAADIIDLRLGFVPDAEIERLFVAADLVVLPYVSATQSGIVQIAYNYDTPVVTTNVGGLPEVVHEGETGFLVPPGDPAALAEAVIRFFAEDWAQRLAAGVACEKERYSWDHLARSLEELAGGVAPGEGKGR